MNQTLSEILKREILSSPIYGIDMLLACSLNADGEFNVVNNKFYGCLDLFGRNSVIINMKNVYDIHKVYFQIRYKYSNALLFIKPVILIVYFFFIFVALILYSRGNLSLKKDSKVKVE